MAHKWQIHWLANHPASSGLLCIYYLLATCPANICTEKKMRWWLMEDFGGRWAQIISEGIFRLLRTYHRGHHLWMPGGAKPSTRRVVARRQTSSTDPSSIAHAVKYVCLSFRFHFDYEAMYLPTRKFPAYWRQKKNTAIDRRLKSQGRKDNPSNLGPGMDLATPFAPRGGRARTHHMPRRFEKWATSSPDTVGVV